MSLTSRTRFVNPRLGTYFGIFASSLAGLVLLLLIFEQLGTSDTVLRWGMLFGPLVLYAAIGLCVPTQEPLEFFAAGRRVPAGYTGLGIGVAALGATGMVAITGVFFLIGFDALCLMIGGLAGFVIMTVMLAPFFRKFGTFTVPSYLGRRFESKTVRLLSAMLLAVPALLMLAAELRMGAFAAGWLAGQPQTLMIVVLVGAFIVSVVLGGMRSLTWSGSAEAIAAVLALIVPVAIVAVMVTNFPLPQLTNGPLLRALMHTEAAQALSIVEAPALAFNLPGDGITHIAKRFTAPFGAIGPTAFVVAMLTVMAGVASSPWLIPRVTMTPGVYETRKSLGWATVYFSLIMLTAAAVSVYMRDFLMDMVVSGPPGTLPAWVQHLVQLGFVTVDPAAAPLTVSSFGFLRDGVLLSLPVAAGLPNVLVYFAAAGIVAAALVGAGATASAFGNVIAEDVVNGTVLGAAAALGPRAHGPARHRRRRGARRRHRHARPGGPAAPAAMVVGAQRLDLLPGAGAVDLVEAHERLRRHRRHDLRLCRRRAHHPCRRSQYPRARRGAGRHPRTARRRARCAARQHRHAGPQPQRAGAGARDPHSRRRGHL